MYCKNCGATFPDGVFECPVCHAMIDEKRNEFNNGSYAQYVNSNEGKPNNGGYENYVNNNEGAPNNGGYDSNVNNNEGAPNNGDYDSYINNNQGTPNNSGSYYTPPQGNYQQNYSNNGWQYHDMQYRNMEEKAETARILAILGLVLGVVVTPILGWILGGIGLSYAKEVYAYLKTPSCKTTITMAKWAIIVASIIAGLALIAVIAWFTLIYAGLVGSAYFDL